MKLFPRSAVALAAAALFPVMAAAQQPAPQGPPPPGGRGGRVQVSRPQLTEQQREQIRAFDEQQRQATETIHREIGDLHRQLNEALTAEKLDTGKINSLRASLVQKETALAQARVERLTKLSSILTPEQRQAMRGRGLGEIFGPGGAGGRGRGGQMVAPRAPMGGRGGGGVIMQRRQGIERQLLQRRALRGGRGGVMAAPRGRGGLIGRGGARDQAEEARLRAEIRRLEAQLELLRRRIR